VVSFYVPDGDWIDLLTERHYVGGRWYERTCDPMQIPLLVRPGTILPMSDRHDSPRWNASDPLNLHVHAFAWDARFASIIGQSGGDKAIHLSAHRREDALVLQADSPIAAATVRFHAHSVVKVIEGGELIDASTVQWSTPQNELVVRLSDISTISRT
jgi:alpha-D-xyloside xylohydrolase